VHRPKYSVLATTLLRDPWRRLSIAVSLVALVTLVGCGDGPSAPSFGRLILRIDGLPDGGAAAVHVTGPRGYRHDFTGSDTLATLSPGTYTVTASPVTSDGIDYTSPPTPQTVTVAAGGVAATVWVFYVRAPSQLAVTAAGLPAGARPTIDVVGPSFWRRVTRDTTLTGLAPGTYTVTAASVTTAGTLYNPAPSSQTLEVERGRTVTAAVTYATSTTGVFNLAIDGMYIVQSTQTYHGDVPLLEGRAGLLRIFGRANQPNGVQPPVRVRLYQNGTLVNTVTVAAAGASVPTAVDEGDLTASWNVVIPAEQLRPGLAVTAEIDPDNAVAEGNEGDNDFPVTGTPLALSVRSAPPFRVRFVPVHESSSGRLGRVTVDNRELFLTWTRQIYPVVDVVSDVRAAYTTSASVDDGDGNVFWNRVLSEVNALRLIDPDAAGMHYYGVVNLTRAFISFTGMGYIGTPTAVGQDYLPGGAHTFAHELGHNWGRQHAPCGDPSDPDPAYPYPGGTNGVYGYDFETGTVKPPTLHDIMGYCSTSWISDYTYRGVMDFRQSHAAAAAAQAPAAQAPRAGLLVWGRIVDGALRLEPAFRVVAPPSLPERPGPYAIEGRAADGSTIFALSFAAEAIADAPRDEQHFAFVVPLADARAARLTTLRLAGQGRAVTVSAAAPAGTRFRVGAGSGAAAVRRVAGRRVALHWDTAAHPMIMVRDPSNGRILSFARGGDAEIVTDSDEVELVASDGIHSQSLRARVAP